MSRKSLSVIIPAFNEEGNVRDAIEGAAREARKGGIDYEIIVVNDGSTDRTGEVIAACMRKNPRVRSITHKKNKGFGSAFLHGVQQARKQYVIGFPGDNDTSPKVLIDCLRPATADTIVMTYPENVNARHAVRVAISKVFIAIGNVLFGLHLKYFNGSFVCRTDRLQTLGLETKGLTVYAEAKIRLIKQGMNYKEVPFVHTGRNFGTSTALTLKSLYETLHFFLRLVYRIYILRQP